MNTAYCNLTEEQGESTICRGIVGCDGIVRGAMADIDLFAAFSVEMGENKNELWEIKDIRDKTVVNRRASETVESERPTVEELSLYYAIAATLIESEIE